MNLEQFLEKFAKPNITESQREKIINELVERVENILRVKPEVVMPYLVLKQLTQIKAKNAEEFCRELSNYTKDAGIIIGIRKSKSIQVVFKRRAILE